MFQISRVREQITYAKTEKSTRDYLIKYKREEDAQPADRTWVLTRSLAGSDVPKRTEFIQNTICLFCYRFILQLFNEILRHSRAATTTTTTTTGIPAESTSQILYGDPRARLLKSVNESAAQGCWVCTHIIRNARRDSKGRIAASFATIFAYGFSMEEFSVVAIGRKPWQYYSTDFTITPIEGNSAIEMRSLKVTTDCF
jgi:hypothetical protein